MSTVRNRTNHCSRNSSTSGFFELWLANSSAEPLPSLAGEKCSPAGNGGLGVFVRKPCSSLRGSSPCSGGACPDTSLACLNCSNQRLRPNITRSVSCVETRGGIMGILLKCHSAWSEMKSTPASHALCLPWRSRDGKPTDLVIRMGFQSLTLVPPGLSTTRVIYKTTPQLKIHTAFKQG